MSDSDPKYKSFQSPMSDAWPPEVLEHSRKMSMSCNPETVTLKWSGRGKLATFNTSLAGADPSIEASDGWGRAIAFMVALIQLGVQPSTVIEALRTCVPKKAKSPDDPG